jgi:hypothetical protein
MPLPSLCAAVELGISSRLLLELNSLAPFFFFSKHLSSRLAKLRTNLKLQHTSGSKPKPFKQLPVLQGEDIKDARSVHELTSSFLPRRP